MKIKMISCVVTVDLKVYDCGKILSTETDSITEDFAKQLVSAKFAIVIEDEKVKEPKRGKKDKSNEVN